MSVLDLDDSAGLLSNDLSSYLNSNNEWNKSYWGSAAVFKEKQTPELIFFEKTIELNKYHSLIIDYFPSIFEGFVNPDYTTYKGSLNNKLLIDYVEESSLEHESIIIDMKDKCGMYLEAIIQKYIKLYINKNI